MDQIGEFAVRDTSDADRLNDDVNNNDNSGDTNCNIVNHIDEEIVQNDINRLDLLEEALKESIALTVQAELQARLKDEALIAANKKVSAIIGNYSSLCFFFSNATLWYMISYIMT